MAFDLEEQEQIDELKQFWNQYGSLIVTLAIAALATIAGVQGWKYYKRTQAEEASARYLKFEEVARKNDVAEIRKLGTELLEKHGSSAYGPMAALVFSKSEYDNGDVAAAEKHLRWAIDNARDEETAALARLRLAGILLDQKKHDDALKLLDAEHGAALVTLYADLRGDVLVAQGKLPEARAAYRLALDKSLPNSSYRNVVQIKLDALGSAK